MTVILTGTRDARARLRARLPAGAITIVAEAANLAAGRALELDVDAYLVAAEDPPAWAAGGARDMTRAVPSIMPRAADEGAGGPDTVESLTPREHEVLAWLAEGLPNRAIADRLGISDQTVKFHVAAIYGKLGAANRTDAVRRALKRGLIQI